MARAAENGVGLGNPNAGGPDPSNYLEQLQVRDSVSWFTIDSWTLAPSAPESPASSILIPTAAAHETSGGSGSAEIREGSNDYRCSGRALEVIWSTVRPSTE